MSNQYAIHGLKVRLAEISAAFGQREKRLKTLGEHRTIITQALALMGENPAEGAVSLGIASGAFTRTILEVLRDSDQPLGVRGIADVLIKRAGRPLDRRETNLVVARVR